VNRLPKIKTHRTERPPPPRLASILGLLVCAEFGFSHSALCVGLCEV
jgi:hypothetical protein